MSRRYWERKSNANLWTESHQIDKNKKWNKVYIKCTTDKGKTCTLNYIVSADFAIGEHVVCETVKGTMEGIITQLMETDVKHMSTHKKVDRLKSEDTTMLNQIFTMVKIQRNNNDTIDYCFTDLEDLTEGAFVVYTTGKGTFRTIDTNNHHPSNLVIEAIHVGMIIEICATPHKISSGSFAFSYVNMSELYNHIDKAKNAMDIKGRLDARKKAFEQHRVYELLAQSDPEARVLLDSLNALNAGKKVLY